MLQRRSIACCVSGNCVGSVTVLEFAASKGNLGSLPEIEGRVFLYRGPDTK